MGKNCYICGADSVSKEHTPARCYFPDDASYRKNLITVPSCKVHNEDTSIDDKYVRNIIAMSIDTNQIAFKQFMAKTVKSFKESPKLLHTTTGTKKRITIDGKQSYAFQIDRDRFDKMMRKISYALYFHEENRIWQRELIIMTKNLVTDVLQLDELGKTIVQFEKIIPINIYDGENPQVFKYSFGDIDSADPDDKILRMIFYEGFHVWIVPVIGTKAPKI